MNITLKRGMPSDQPIFHRLMQLYLYDFSEFLPLYVDDHGLFEQTILEAYFVNATKYPFLIIANQAIAGFILVNADPVLPQHAGGKRLKEFFVLRGFRRKQVGRQAAIQVFNLFPGRWEVGVVATNLPAQRFWERTIDTYTCGRYTHDLVDDATWSGPIFSFDLTHPRGGADDCTTPVA